MIKGAVKNIKFFNSPQKCRTGFRCFGCDFGRFCLDFVFSTFLVAKRRFSTEKTKVVGEGKKLILSFLPSPFYMSENAGIVPVPL